jgi:hypothetical protein
MDTKKKNHQLNKNIKKNINSKLNGNSNKIDYHPKIFIPHSSGFKIWWLLGFYDSLVSQNINIQDNIFLSWSGGAIATALYLSGVPGKTFIQKSLILFEKKYGHSNNYSLYEIADLIKPLFENILPEDCHLKCSNRLHIVYYNFPFGYETISHFNSKSNLINNLCMCCYIPFITKNIENNTTLSDTFIGISNEILYNFIEYSDKDNIDIYRFYYWELHTNYNLLEKFNFFYFSNKQKIIDLYNYGVTDSNILIYKFNLNQFKYKSIHTYLSKEIYETKKFKIKKRQKNFYILKQILRFVSIITACYILIYYILKFTLRYFT